jgi:hypothetical protein
MTQKLCKKPSLRFFSFFLLLFFYSIGFCNDKNTFTILSSTQTLKFSQEEGKLIARLDVVEFIKCNSKTGELFKKVIYFDDESAIEKITIDGAVRKYIISNDLPSGGIFHNDTKLAYFDYRFGTNTEKSIELRYTKKFLDFKFIDLLSFNNYHYATKESMINVEIPSWLNCSLKEFNFENATILKSDDVDDDTKIQVYKATSIPVQSDLKSRPDFRKYEPHIMVLPNFMTVNNKKVELMPSLDKLYSWYKSLANQIGNDTKVIEAKAKELTAGLSNDEDKIKAIFYFIQDNIKYIAFEAGIMGFKPESCQNVLQKKYGDCKGMANLAKTMLVSLGFDARLTWLGTNDIPYDYSFPSLYVDNHMICTVLLNGKQIFVDPTETESDLNQYADRIQGREVLIEDGVNFIKSRVPFQDESKHGFTQKMNLQIDGNKVIGDAVEVMKGNNKTRFANFIKSISKKDKIDALKYYVSQNDNNILVSSHQQDIYPQHDQDFKLEYNLSVNNQILQIGKEKYINLEFEKPLEFISIEDGRDCAFDLDNKINKDYTTVFSIPANHKVTYVPDPIAISNEDWDVKMSYEIAADKVIYKKSLHTKTTEIKKSKLAEWKLFSTKLKEFYEDRIIIKEN